jgi:transcription initiation factor TFIID TATA-box-binding protein
MKHQTPSNEETRELLITNRLHHNSAASDLDEVDIFHSHPTTTNDDMMTNDSALDSTGTKMLMPHEMGAASTGGGGGAQHSIHSSYDQLNHGASFYSSGGFNGFHNNSFHSYSTLNNSTMITNHHNNTFNNLIHQQTNNNHHHTATTAPTTASSVPPLIHQQTFYTQKPQQSPSEEAEKKEADDVKDSTTTVDDDDDDHNKVPAADDEKQPEENEEPEPEIDIVISNVVCAFSVRCPLTLKDIALNGANVEYKRENGMVTMKLRKPYTTASIWSSGKITCTGATSEDQARVAARRYARVLQKLNFRVRFQNYRVVNVLGTCKMPWAIKIVQFSEKYKKEASYEPELHPGVTYNLHNPTATLKIFSTGSMTVTGELNKTKQLTNLSMKFLF